MDPMASGLLLLLVGRDATKQQDYFLKQTKTYDAVLELGRETDTWDAYGEETQTAPIPPFTLQDVQQATQTLTGEVEQPIPFFSAKKIGGERMYDLARNGHEIERRYNTVRILQWSNITLLPNNQIAFTLTCSCGTYVRSMGWMLAQKLGTTGHICALRRTRIGDLDVKDAFDGALIKDSTPGTIYSRFIPVPQNRPEPQAHEN